MVLLTFCAPGPAPKALLWRLFPQAGLNFHGLVVDVTERGDPSQRRRAIEYMLEKKWKPLNLD